MADFERETHTVNGVRTVVLTAGKGEPLVFWHGAGTFTGFNFAKPWAEKFRVIIPFHPGFGESGDDPAMTDLHDYVMHYLDLFDALDLAKLRLVGFSLGGYLAAKFAMEHGHRVSKLALVGPAGLRDQDYPTADVLALPPEQLPTMLASNFEVIRPHLPVKPDLDFVGDRYREMTTVARLLWERPWDATLPRYLHRIKMPTLLVWGEEDQLTPAGQSKLWRRLIHQAEISIFKGAGHLVLDEKPEAVRTIAKFLA
jgi:pimeloyl-ACP methyl ester carboxylesterase